MKVKKFFKENVEYFVNEKNRTITAVCKFEEGFREFRSKLDNMAGTYMPIPKKYFDCVVKTTVVCAEEDEWNVEVGKKIAFEKLYRQEIKPKLFDLLYYYQRKAWQLDMIIEETIIQNRSYKPFNKNFL